MREAQQGIGTTIKLDENCLGEHHSYDVVYAWIRGQWVFAPKFELCGKPKLVAQLFVPQYEGSEYWDKGIDTSRDDLLFSPDRVSRELLFTRFACSVFYSLGSFLQAGADRLLVIGDHKGEVQPCRISAPILPNCTVKFIYYFRRKCGRSPSGSTILTFH